MSKQGERSPDADEPREKAAERDTPSPERSFLDRDGYPHAELWQVDELSDTVRWIAIAANGKAKTLVVAGREPEDWRTVRELDSWPTPS